MTICYRKLWHLLVDKNMKKSDLQREAKISWNAISKLTKNMNVNTEVLVKIGSALGCELSDIAEFEKDGNNDER